MLGSHLRNRTRTEKGIFKNSFRAKLKAKSKY